MFLLGRNTPRFLAAVACHPPCRRVCVSSCELGTGFFQQQLRLSAGVMVSVRYGGVCIQERQPQAAVTPACTWAGKGRRCQSLSSSRVLWLLNYSALLGQKQDPGTPAPMPGMSCGEAHARWAAARAGGDRKGPFSPRPVAGRFALWLTPRFLPSQASRRSSSWTPRET